MTLASLLRLFTLAAIWGGSFLFMRISAPVLGPLLTAECRVGLAALFLLAVSRLFGKPLQLSTNGRHYLIIGALNSALPFLLFGFAAQTLSASLLSILNATSPIWGAVITAIWTRQPLAPRTMLGLALGIIGVTVLVGIDSSMLNGSEASMLLAIAAALGGAFFYGLASTYARSAKAVEPFANAHGSMWAATLLLAPALPFFPAPATPGPGVLLAVLALGVLCSGIAYLLYFRLIADIGAAPALTVTFLIPVFGILMGNLFLGEPITLRMAVGGMIVVIGTALVTGFSPRALLNARSKTRSDAHG